MSGLPYFVDNWPTDGSDIIDLTCRLPFTPSKIPGTHFCERLSPPLEHRAAGRNNFIMQNHFVTKQDTLLYSTHQN
jgi:hypothetical protein